MTSITLRLTQRGVVTIPKRLRESYGLQLGDSLTLLDLGGVFVLNPHWSEIDALAARAAAQWTDGGETLATMLKALREEPDRRACQDQVPPG